MNKTTTRGRTYNLYESLLSSIHSSPLSLSLSLSLPKIGSHLIREVSTIVIITNFSSSVREERTKQLRGEEPATDENSCIFKYPDFGEIFRNFGLYSDSDNRLQASQN
ncbi:hypothetical protein NE237_018028 [Protea cynaroides]|uniref:Uncharacterized protein n=1 Tax=Protea cynaroides TaxID=273540 RepID=A0A9Q0QNS8_9MAGN|nr:hypothetical protein NE237_018028 [Protea cynaroides]